MGVPDSEVGYTPAMPRREEHEAHKDMWWNWTKKKLVASNNWEMASYKSCPLSQLPSDF